MKRIHYLSALMAAGLLYAGNAVAQDPVCAIPGATLCDNMDSYTAGDALGPGASWWTTWSGAEGGSEDGEVTDLYAYSAPNSMTIEEGGLNDVILKLGNQSSGYWRLEWQMLVPEGKSGYYNIQESETPGIAWNTELVFALVDYVTPAPDGTGNVLIPGAAEFSYPVGEWFKVEHLIDLDADNIEIWIDGVMVYTGAYTGNIGSVDFYSIDADCRYYIDDVLLTDMMPVTGTGAYYINSNTTGGEPWFSSSNLDALAANFGEGYTHEYFETVDVDAAFSSENCFVFLEGSDSHADELEAFLDANIDAIEAWVASGGHLLLNAAPNEGDGMSFGFDGTSLVYAYFTDNAEAADPGHPIFAGPFTPVGTNWTGTSFGHAVVTGTDLNPLNWDEFSTGIWVLAEKAWGAGTVLFGGMTTNNFHSPSVEAANLRANIISYLSCTAPPVCNTPGAPSVEIISSTYASVTWEPVEGVERYVFAIRDNTTGERWNRQTTDTFMELTALEPGHSYTVRLRSVCYPSGFSAPGPQTDFTMPLRIGDVSNSMTIYPNPNNGQFNLLLSGYDAAQVMVNITNTVGQVVFTASIAVDGDNTVQEINLENMAAGTYFVHLTDGQRNDVQTLVIK